MTNVAAADARTAAKGKAGEWLSVHCAFCRGTGKDPFGLLSRLSDCQNCLGSGEVGITGPVRTCPFCDGSGRHRRLRLTCIVCGGTGAVTVPEPFEICPRCHGRGASVIAAPREQAGRIDYLHCPTCRGKGVVSAGIAARCGKPRWARRRGKPRQRIGKGKKGVKLVFARDNSGEERKP